MSKKFEDYYQEYGFNFNKSSAEFSSNPDVFMNIAQIDMLNDLAKKIEKLEKDVKKTTTYCEGFTIGLQTRMRKLEQTKKD